MLDTVDAEDQPRLMHILVDPESPFDGEATKELRRVTTSGGSSPVWSPDATQIAYERAGWIWIVGVDGSNRHPLIQGSDPDWQPLH